MEPNRVACHYWRRGDCRSGNNCRFSHDPNAPISMPTAAPKGDTFSSIKRAAMVRGLGVVMSSFELSKLDDSFDGAVGIKDYKLLASYNWSNAVSPTIFVPGSPARWTEPPLPHRLPRDSGMRFIDQNTHRCPTSTFSPLFRSLLTLHPNFDMTPVSVVTDRNNIRKLVKFVTNGPKESFRIGADLVENTLFLTRWEFATSEVIKSNRGHGHEFEKAFTTFDKDVAQSSGHHRIVQYRLGGINCLVRFEADAYLEDNASPPTQTSLPSQDIAGDVLAAALESLQIKPSPSPASIGAQNEVNVTKRGRLVSPSSIIEAKTRKSSRTLDMNEVLPQLWVSQTPHLFVGYHDDGLITADITRREMTAEIETWENGHQTELKKLVSLLRRIKELLGGRKDGKCVLVYDVKDKPDKLVAFESQGKGLILPSGVREKCWRMTSGSGSDA